MDKTKDGLPGPQGVNIRQTILETIPERKGFTADEIENIVSERYRFTPEGKLKNLFGKVFDTLEELVEEGILSKIRKTRHVDRTMATFYSLDFPYLAGRQ